MNTSLLKRLIMRVHWIRSYHCKTPILKNWSSFRWRRKSKKAGGCILKYLIFFQLHIHFVFQ